MVAETIRVGHAMVVLKALVVLRLGRVLMLSVLLVVVYQVRHSAPPTVEARVVTLLMVL